MNTEKLAIFMQLFVCIWQALAFYAIAHALLIQVPQFLREEFLAFYERLHNERE